MVRESRDVKCVLGPYLRWTINDIAIWLPPMAFLLPDIWNIIGDYVHICYPKWELSNATASHELRSITGAQTTLALSGTTRMYDDDPDLIIDSHTVIVGDLFCRNLEVKKNTTLFTNGYILFTRDTLIYNGTIDSSVPTSPLISQLIHAVKNRESDQKPPNGKPLIIHSQ